MSQAIENPLLIFDLGNVILRHNDKILFDNISNACIDPEQARLTLKTIFDTKRADFELTETFFDKIRETIGLNGSFFDFEKLWCSHFTHDPAMENFVRALAQKYRLVVLSNTNDSHWRFLLREYDIMQVPHALYTSFELGLEKPALDIYRHVLDAEGVSANQAVFIDDKQENAAAAAALGIHGIHFTGIEALKADLRLVGVTV